jgi:ferredoxin
MNDKHIKYLIVGTGPTGVATGAALIDRGITPVFIDSGSFPEKNTLDKVHVDLGGNQTINLRKNVARKTWFGDESIYVPHPGSTVSHEAGIEARSSNGVGGYSRVWGATFDFPNAYDNWPPFSAPEQVDIDAICKLVPHATTTWKDPKPNSLIGSGLIGEINAKSKKLKSNIWKHQPSKLAINVVSESRGCIACALCLTGCPTDSIWYSGDVLREWVSQGKAVLITGHHVQSYVEFENHVAVLALNSEKSIEFIAEKVVIAAGPLGTAAIIARSFPSVSPIRIHETTAIFSAGFSLRPERLDSPRHSLSQMWISRNQFMAQIYGPDSGNLIRLISRVGWLNPFRALMKPIISRMVPMICYLGQKSSSSLLVQNTGGKIFVTKGDKAKNLNAFMNLWLLSTRLLRLGVFFPWFFSEISSSGSGYHMGASFPMGHKSDFLGRLISTESKRVFIVDASVLPEIQVGSITPTAMANAYRIGRLI